MPTTWFNDTFTDTDLKLLSAHMSDSGATYASVIGVAGTSPMLYASVGGGSVGPGSLSFGMWRGSVASPTVDQVIAASFYLFSANYSSAGIGGRVATDGSRGYALIYTKATQKWGINRLVAGAFTELAASVVMALTTSTPYAAELRITGTNPVNIEAFVNGVSVATYADSDANRATAAGYPATWFNSAGGGQGQGLFLQNITGSDESIAQPAATAVTLSAAATSGSVGAASSNFTAGADGVIAGTVTVTPSDSGAGGTFTPTSVAISSGTPTATFTYTPASAGAKTISVTNNGSLANPSNITYTATSAGAPTAGAASFVSATATTVNVACAAASGGTAPLTYQWHRSPTSNFAIGAGTVLAGATSLALADSAGLAAGTPYYYRLRVTDAAASTSDSNQVAGVRKAAGLAIGFIGDSITFGFGLSAGQDPVTAIAPILSKLHKNREVTAINRGVSASRTNQWLSGSTNLVGAKAAFAAASVTHVHIMLGANDAAVGSLAPASVYKTNLQNIIADLTGAGYKVILSYPTYIPAGANSNTTTAESVALAQAYQAEIDSLINNTTVLRGDTLAFNYFMDSPAEYQADKVHLTAAGSVSLAQMWARAIDRSVLDSTAQPTLTPRTVSLTLGTASGPAANLTGLKVAFHDEASPAAFTVPRYQSASETTDGSGVLAFSVSSTLAAGGTGHLTVLGAADVHYNGPVQVS